MVEMVEMGAAAIGPLAGTSIVGQVYRDAVDLQCGKGTGTPPLAEALIVWHP
jgi:hypothetical protein